MPWIPRKVSHNVFEIQEIPKEFSQISMKIHFWARAHRPPSVAANSDPKRRRDTAKLPNWIFELLPKLIFENQQSYRSEIISELIT